MDNIFNTEDFRINPGKYILPSVAINNVIFGFDDNNVKVLLLRTIYTNKWTLPGGFVLRQDELITAAERILKMFTGLRDSVFLKQFGVFNRKIFSFGILDKKEKFYSGAAHKAPFLYSFNKEEYFNALENGLGGF